MSFFELDERLDDDFYRWYVGGSPPAADGWSRHAFEQAFQGIVVAPPGGDCNGRMIDGRDD